VDRAEIWSAVLGLGVALAAPLVAAWLLVRLAHALGAFGASLVRHGARPATALLLVLSLLPWLASLPFGPAGAAVATHVGSLALIGAITWCLVAVLRIVQDSVVRRYDITAADNLLARKVQTRLAVLRRVANALIVVIAVAAMLMTFPEVRLLGGSLLASAGPVMTNLLAGMQIALTQPVRLDDVVVVNDYWGRIEAIDSTFVVLQVWDQRRLIIPLSYLLAQPFENWTYNGTDLLGYVHVYADYGVDVERVREALLSILRASPEWDGKVANIQMTQADELTVQLRALFSTRNSDDRWNLMVRVREELIAHLRRDQPGHLPRYRLEAAAARAPAGPGANGPA
jgi:small-conductance mechanosensitive channel